MHLVGPYMTTTNYKKRKQKGLTQKDKQAKIEHDKWLKKMGVHPDQLAEKKAKRGNVKTVDFPDYSSDSSNNIRTSDNIPSGSTAPKERQVYSGERQLLGVATMHKSNMVPVFADKKEDAKDIAKMRRG
tara:strand:+ start:3188 stop:3574 length:387 start_codon:yes stop_codon:yes gene_type:complete